uniref:Uncharacterized protein n=1 Tax=Anoplophora glabripennis TaxID=217634 RepID=V5I9N4_ANOGL
MTARHDGGEPSQCPLLSEQIEFRKHRPRDSLKLINERLDKDEIMDEDSEAEKLSPLLQKTDLNRSNNLALHMADVTDSIDDTDTDHDEPTNVHIPEKLKSYNERGDESDYYTPDEPGPSAGPLYEEATTSSVGSTPHRPPPGTPHSHASVRSSEESCTSGSSTRHLLAVISGNNSGSSERSVNN